MTNDKLRQANGAVTFVVKVVPRASKNQIAGVEGDALKVRLTAPPVEGKANDALIAFLAEMLGVRRAQIEIISGQTARRKIVRVRGVTAEDMKKKPGFS
ncbi:MAG: YggU family protein [Chloroflexi bacterium]|nr:YggU family protein [Chloroflexota bacterium]